MVHHGLISASFGIVQQFSRLNARRNFLLFSLMVFESICFGVQSSGLIGIIGFRFQGLGFRI